MSIQKIIAEKIDEEDKDSQDEFDAYNDKVKKSSYNTQKVKKNYLLKNLLDQTKEFCYEHSTLYKDFDTQFMKILSRFYQWEIFDDSEIQLACQVNLVVNVGDSA